MPDEGYVRRGSMFVFRADCSWGREVEAANAGKVGRPYGYADGLFEAPAVVRCVTGASYRECEGIAREALGAAAPDLQPYAGGSTG